LETEEPLSKKFAFSLCLVALALSSLPAMAQSTFFSNLGTGTDVYYCCEGWTMGGTGTLGTSYTLAEEFTAGQTGSFRRSTLALAMSKAQTRSSPLSMKPAAALRARRLRSGAT
jgi:hypothetical protein